MEEIKQLVFSPKKLNYVINRITVGCLFSVILIYNSHRYLFKYNSTATSPTYTNTPIFWKVFKYGLVLVLLAIIYLNNKQKRTLNVNILLIYVVVFIILLINILNFFIYREILLDEFEFLIYFLLLFPLTTTNDNFLSLVQEKLPAALVLTAKFIIFTNLIVIFNYFVFGRLPALAYKDSSLVRFGGLWDDPNGVGFLSVFLFFYFLQIKRPFISGLLLFTIIMTISFSSYLILIIGFVYWSPLRSLKIKKNWLYAFLILIPFSIAGINYLFDKLIDIYQLKKGSVDAHLTFDFKLSILPLLGQPLRSHESWLVSFFFNYFPLSPVIIAFILLFIFKSIFLIKREFIGFYIYLFLIGCLFIPFTSVFPINFIFIVLLIFYLRGIRLWIA